MALASCERHLLSTIVRHERPANAQPSASSKEARPASVGVERRQGPDARYAQRSSQPGRRGLRGGAISPDGSGVRTPHDNAMRSRALQSRDAAKESRAFVFLWNSSHLDQSPFAFRRAFSIAMSARTNSHSTGSRALSGIGSKPLVSGNSKACPIAFCPTVIFAPRGLHAQAQKPPAHSGAATLRARPGRARGSFRHQGRRQKVEPRRTLHFPRWTTKSGECCPKRCPKPD